MNIEACLQKQNTSKLFKAFDADGSGALDSGELTILYNENGVNVLEEDIQKMYGREKVEFTLDMFESITK